MASALMQDQGNSVFLIKEKWSEKTCKKKQIKNIKELPVAQNGLSFGFKRKKWSYLFFPVCVRKNCLTQQYYKHHGKSGQLSKALRIGPHFPKLPGRRSHWTSQLARKARLPAIEKHQSNMMKAANFTRKNHSALCSHHWSWRFRRPKIGLSTRAHLAEERINSHESWSAMRFLRYCTSFILE